MGKLYTSSPQVRVTFHPQTAKNLGTPFVFGESLDPKTGPEKYDDLISVQTRKDLHTPCGHFTVVLCPRTTVFNHQYRSILRPGDMVIIEMGPDQPERMGLQRQIIKNQGYAGLEVVMIGTIDEVLETTSFNLQTGAPQRTITITGRDLAKYLMDDMVWWDAWSQTDRAITGFDPEIDEWLRAGGNDSKTAAVIGILLKWLADHFDIAFDFASLQKPTARRLFSEIMRYDLSLGSPTIASPFKLENAHGSPWALIEQLTCPPLFIFSYDVRRLMDLNTVMDPQGPSLSNNNRSFITTENGNWQSIPSLLFYRNPWSNRDYDDFVKLPTRVVEDGDLLSREVSRHNDEVSNTWRVWSEAQGPYRILGAGSIAQANRLRDYESIQRYGERPLIINSPFVSGLKQGEEADVVKTYSFRLKDWNRWNEFFLSGQLTIKGMAAARVGDRLWHWDREFGDYAGDGFVGGTDYYLESVTQDFQAFTGWKTTLGVSRGQVHRQKGELLIYDDVDFTEADANDPNSAKRNRLRELAAQVSVWELT